MSLEIYGQPTPNPNALKFIVNCTLKEKGKSSYKNLKDCEHVPLATELFKLRGVDQIHIFQNSVTITKFSYEDWNVLEPKVEETLAKMIPDHDPNYEDKDPEEERRKNLSKELQEIESIMDRTIRPGLQADGGDLQCIDYRDDVLIIQYQGACGNCPSSQYGTLNAIKSILRDEYNPEIEVYATQNH